MTRVRVAFRGIPLKTEPQPPDRIFVKNSASHRMFARVFSSGRWPLLTVAVSVAGYAIVTFLPLEPEALKLAKDLLYLVAPLTSGVLAIRLLIASRGTPLLSFGTQLSFGTILLVAGEIAWCVLDLTLPESDIPSPGVADYLFSAGYAFLMASSGLLVRFSKGEIIRRLRYLFDAAIFSVAVLVVTWIFLLAPQLTEHGHFDFHALNFSTIYPLFDVATLTLIFLSVLGFKKQAWSPAEKLFATSVGLFFVADLAYNSLELSSSYDTALASSLVPDLTWMFGYLALALALRAVPAHQRDTDDRVFRLDVTAKSELSWIDVYSPVFSLIVAMMITYSLQFWVDDRFTHRLMTVVSIFIVASVIVRNALVVFENRSLANVALRDPLTGLYNHRFFHEQLEREVERSRREGTSVTVVAIDLDDFAVLNDTLGHQAGDELLARFAAALVTTIRVYDIAARLGGDEFALILADTTADEASTLVRRVGESLASMNKGPLTITFSAGIAAFPEHAVSKDDLLRKADSALYWSKYNGKDTTTVYDESLRFLSPNERIERIREQSYLNTVKVLASAVDARDPYTQHHSRNVAALAALLATRLGLAPDHVKLVEVAALLHDVGKLGVSDNLLKKDGPLTDDEVHEIREHPLLATKILNSGNLRRIIPWVRSHHERWDGRGYPDGLKGESIPLESRIIAICDAYDAMLSERHYRPAMSKREAIAELLKESGKQFDPELVRSFLDIVASAEEPYGQA